MFNRFREDIQAVFDRDPAARNRVEVMLAYPGLHALLIHRVAHRLYLKNFYTLSRLISHFNRFFTGIEIHPGATIGQRVFIDHGMGVVIGETAEVGDDCLIYKGVVLGGVHLEKKKRHPTLEKGVVVGSNACILGAITIGEHSRIGSGSVVVENVPPNSTVVGIPGKVIKKQTTGDLDKDLEHSDLPDPLQDVIASWLKLFEQFEKRLQGLEQEHGIKEKELIRNYDQALKSFQNKGPNNER